MINTKIYKAVYSLSEQLMEAANKDDRKAFDAGYARLKSICLDNENTPKDHPEQWETLADFTEELVDALVLYAKALNKAISMNATDHMASIAFSMAKLQLELGQKYAAIKSLEAAKISAQKTQDSDLRMEIAELINSVSSK
jgi:cell division protein FtsL